jgi:bisanhydrobacterioruberin hydratase
MSIPFKRPPTALAGKLFIIYYTVGLFGLSLPQTRALFTTLMPFSLLMSLIILFLYHPGWKWKEALAVAAVAIAGYLIEVAGVLTGHVFGQYSYGPSLGPQLFDTPLIIGINWIMLIYCVYAIVAHFRMGRWISLLVGATLMVAYDYLLEPVAIRLDMWSWAGGNIPLQNYLAWYLISLLFLFVLQQARVNPGNRLTTWLFFTQSGFFLLLNLTLRIF